MQKQGFLYWIFSKAKKPFYVNDAGIVQEGDAATLLTQDGKAAHLKNSPDGWKDVLVKYGRNIKWMGLFREFSATMKFKKDGAMIMRYLMWTYGIEAICYLGISKLNRTIFPDKYEAWYTGEPDFSKFNQKKTDVSINIMEGGLNKLLKAYENTTYEIPVDADPQAVTVYMDGFPFTNKVQYIFIEGIYPLVSNFARYWYMGIAIANNEGSTQGILVQDQEKGGSDTLPNDKWFMMSIDKTISITITGTVNITVLSNPDDKPLKLYIDRVNEGVVVQAYTLYDTVHAADDVVVITVNETISLAPGDQLYLIDDKEEDPFQLYFHKVTGGELFITYDVTFRPTIIKALHLLRLFQKLIEKITDGKYLASSLLLASLTDYVVTSGSAIRNHEGDTNPTTTGSLIKTSLTEFFQATFSRWGVGLGIENNTVIIEKLEYFFKNNIAIILGEVDDFSVIPAEDLMFNTIKAGYANQTYDEVNGKDEVNVTQQYTTPITRVVRQLDLVSPYRADPTGIELTRLNLYGKDTTDNNADNDTFLINVKDRIPNYNGSISITAGPSIFIINATGIDFGTAFGYKYKFTTVSSVNPGPFTIIYAYETAGTTVIEVEEAVTPETLTGTIHFRAYILNRPVFDSITGVLHPAGIFNVLLSPKTGLLNNGPLINSIMDLQEMNFIKFQTGEKNSELSRTLAGVTITEKADVQIATLAPKLFKPYYFNFTTAVPINFMELMRSNPYDKISFVYQGNTYTGFLWDGGIKPATNDKQSWKLLSSADNDMLKLINTI